MLLTFTIDSSVDIQDSYFDECFPHQRALWASIRACFGPGRALWASIQVWGEFQTLSFKVFDWFGLCTWSLTSDLGFPVLFCGCHQHWLVGAAPAPLAGAGPKQAPEQGVEGQQPCQGSSSVSESCHTFVGLQQL